VHNLVAGLRRIWPGGSQATRAKGRGPLGTPTQSGSRLVAVLLGAYARTAKDVIARYPSEPVRVDAFAAESCRFIRQANLTWWIVRMT
jgi:hypothetical protein